MTTRTHAITALVLAGAAIAASPAMAAAGLTAGNKGPAELPTDRAAPFSLPAVTPMPTPEVDRSVVSRDILALDPAAALDALTTVTLSRDGTVTQTPPSDALRAAFDTETAGNRGG
jgi:hypothetical protein